MATQNQTVSNIVGTAQTLIDYARNSNSPMVQKYIKDLYFQGDLRSDMYWRTDPTFTQRALVYTGVMSPSWVQLNKPGWEQDIATIPYTEQAWLSRDDIKTDKQLLNERNQVGGKGALYKSKIDNYMEGQKYQFNTYFFQNGPTGTASTITNGRIVNPLVDATNGGFCADPLAPVGLRYRLDNPTIYNCLSENKISAGGVDMSPSGMSASSANRFFVYLAQLINYVSGKTNPNGDGVTLYADDFMIRQMEAGLRLLGTGGWGFVKDAYDQTITSFHNALIKDPGRLSPSVDTTQALRILTTNEKTDGTDGVIGTDKSTSIYAVRHGSDDQDFSGWQTTPPEVLPLGLMPDGATHVTHFEWMIGFWQPGKRSIGRLFDIKILD